MWTRGRGWAMGVAIGAVVVTSVGAACRDGASNDRRTARTAHRDLRLAGTTDASVAARVPTVAPDEVPAVALPARARRRVAVAPAPAPVRRAIAHGAAQDAAPVVAEPTPEPATERMVRYADQEGLIGSAAGVAVRGGAVGDDWCEREVSGRRGGRAIVSFQPVTVRLGAPTFGPRVPVGGRPAYAPF